MARFSGANWRTKVPGTWACLITRRRRQLSEKTTNWRGDRWDRRLGWMWRSRRASGWNCTSGIWHTEEPASVWHNLHKYLVLAVNELMCHLDEFIQKIWIFKKISELCNQHWRFVCGGLQSALFKFEFSFFNKGIVIIKFFLFLQKEHWIGS